jgi:hypothetical protein
MRKIPKRLRQQLFIFASAALVASGAHGAANVVSAASSFDGSLDGWTRVAGQTANIEYASQGGNPGGYLRSTDRGPTLGEIIAPGKFLGSWEALDGKGTLSWSFRLFDAGPNAGTFTTVSAWISGPGGAAVFDTGVVPTVNDGWINFKADIRTDAWKINSGSWLPLLQNVTELKLQVETVLSTSLPGEVSGIDNVSISPVPESSTLALFVSGLGIVAAIRISARSKAQFA